MANWTMITIERNYHVDYVYEPFKDALLMEKFNQTRDSLKR